MAHFVIEDLSFTYPKSTEKALDSINLKIERGEFLTLMGATGSGKSTLLRMLKPELRINGTTEGKILFDGTEMEMLSAQESAARIGYVAQNPEEQIVTDKVWHELAFTLENLGKKRDLIARRIAEISTFFGIDDLYDHPTATLSGGQKQLLNLAAVMTADPEVLILDEPTAQLDPIAASRFIDTLVRLNRETGVTVIICEHRAEELLPVSDRVAIIEKGHIQYCGTPREIARQLDGDSPYLSYMPAATRIYAMTGGGGEPPLSIREGQRYVEQFSDITHTEQLEESSEKSEIALELKNIWFRYERAGKDVLKDCSMTVYKGEVYALLGANGAGKSTAAAVAAGLKKPYGGSVSFFGKRLKEYKNGSLYRENLSMLPQDAESVFLHETVEEELKGCEAVFETFPYDLKPLFNRHPYDISGGEKQLVALCKALSTDPRFLILDEPSKGLDNNAKKRLQNVIKDLKERGVTILLISHDVEFAALCSDRCALFSQGQIAAVDEVGRFMSANRFYTTAASRITRNVFDGAYTVDRAVEQIGGAR